MVGLAGVDLSRQMHGDVSVIVVIVVIVVVAIIFITASYVPCPPYLAPLGRPGRHDRGHSHAQLCDHSDGCAEALPPAKDNFHFVAGDIRETAPNNLHPQIALLRLDTDWYESAKHELVHLFPRLSKNGVVIIDDYGHWDFGHWECLVLETLVIYNNPVTFPELRFWYISNDLHFPN